LTIVNATGIPIVPGLEDDTILGTPSFGNFLVIKIDIPYLWDNQDEAEIEIDNNLEDVLFHSQEDQDF
jgi:hypothetical protein